MQIFLAVGAAYGVYVAIFFLPFFPFINMTGLYLCLGIGADDVFVMVQSFDDAIRKRGKATNGGIDAELIHEVLLDGGTATLVTSMTTAGAFFASVSSSITAIKCFGVFCGLVVMCDWLMMVFFLPPLAVLYQTGRLGCGRGSCQATRCPNIPLAANERQLSRPALSSLYDRCLGKVIEFKALNVVWVAAMIGLAFGAGAIFIGNDLALPFPSSSTVQMFRDNHPFERYCCAGPQVQTKFTLGAPGSESWRYITLTFGLDPVDNGNPWDPDSYPVSKTLGGVDLTSKASQTFLLQLSRNAMNAPWFAVPPERVAETDGRDLLAHPQWPFNTSIEIAFNRFWGKACSEQLSASNQCCGLSSSNYPFEPSLFNKCAGEMSTYVATSKTEAAYRHAAAAGLSYYELTMESGVGLWYDPSGNLKVLTLAFPTNYRQSEKYEPTKEFWTTMKAWAAAELANAPPDLRGGFVSVPYGSLNYYSLQTAMADSAKTSMYIALLVALLVLTVFTRNALIAVYTTGTVMFIMLTVLGLLMSDGWEQGIMESIIISCGIGMACDFAAHIGYAYRQANKRREATDRTTLARLAMQRMAPSLSAAAFSTGVMGAFMLGSNTLFTIRFGIFILMVMGFGWMFAMFFLVPLLALAGPLGNCGELCFFWKARVSSSSATTEVGLAAATTAEEGESGPKP